MAPSRRKKKPAAFGPPSPNIALIIFVILFFLGCVGLGLVVYDGQKKLEEKKKAEVAAAQQVKEANQKTEYFRLQTLYYLSLIGYEMTADETKDRNDLEQKYKDTAKKDEIFGKVLPGEDNFTKRRTREKDLHLSDGNFLATLAKITGIMDPVKLDQFLQSVPEPKIKEFTEFADFNVADDKAREANRPKVINFMAALTGQKPESWDPAKAPDLDDEARKVLTNKLDGIQEAFKHLAQKTKVDPAEVYGPVLVALAERRKGWDFYIDALSEMERGTDLADAKLKEVAEKSAAENTKAIKASQAAVVELNKTEETLRTKIEKYDKFEKQVIDRAVAAKEQQVEALRADRKKDLDRWEGIKKENEEKIKKLQAELNSMKLLNQEIEKFAKQNPDAVDATKFPGLFSKKAVAVEKPKSSDYGLPRGKIISVDPTGKMSFINLGSKHRVTKGTTFSVFGKNDDKSGESQPKATLEVVNVFSEDISQARATGMRNERSEPLLEGDELYNPGVDPSKSEKPHHVVVAGIIDLNGDGSLNVADQVRNLMDFIAHLERQGFIIDAYLDLSDLKFKRQGQEIKDVKFTITPKTEMLILGDNPIGDGNVAGGKNIVKNPLLERKESMANKITEMSRFADRNGLRLSSAYRVAQVTGYKPPKGISGYDLDNRPQSGVEERKEAPPKKDKMPPRLGEMDK